MPKQIAKKDMGAANQRFDTQRARYLYLTKLGYSQAQIAAATPDPGRARRRAADEGSAEPGRPLLWGPAQGSKDRPEGREEPEIGAKRLKCDVKCVRSQLSRFPPPPSDPWPRPGDVIDEGRKAKLPGRRVAEKSGKVYYERRRNRSDMPWKKV